MEKPFCIIERKRSSQFDVVKLLGVGCGVVEWLEDSRIKLKKWIAIRTHFLH